MPKPKPLIGPNLEATVITYKQKQHVSVERVVETMNDLHGVKLSEGAVCSIPERAGKRAEPQAEAIKKQVIAQALRSSVIHRKVTNGFRSEWGAKAYAALQTILATAKQKGEDAFQTLANLMGTPILPFVEALSP